MFKTDLKIIDSMQVISDPYRELQRHLDKLPIGYPATDSGVEIRILNQLFTPQQAAISLHLSLIPQSVNTIINHIKKRKQLKLLSKSDIEHNLKELGDKGAIMVGKNKKLEPVYSNAMLAIGMFEFQGDFITKEFATDMLQYMEEGFRDVFFKTGPLQMRTIPALRAYSPEFPISTYDDIRKMIQNVTGPISLVNCVCKLSQDQMGHPCKVSDERIWCMSFSYNPQKDPDDHPSFHKERQILTQSEALERIEQAEKVGLVLQPSNSRKPMFLCMCCGDCCGVLTEAKKLANPASFFQTNYQISFDLNLCITCKICTQRCQMDAISFATDHIEIQMDHCIGCGLCVSTCKPKALQLIPLPNQRKPPKSTLTLYLKILEAKLGRLPAYEMLLGLLFEKIF
jgi:ferredoxin